LIQDFCSDNEITSIVNSQQGCLINNNNDNNAHNDNDKNESKKPVLMLNNENLSVNNTMSNFFPKNTLSIDNEKTQTQKIVEKIYENMKRESCFQITNNDTTHNTLKQKKKLNKHRHFNKLLMLLTIIIILKMKIMKLILYKEVNITNKYQIKNNYFHCQETIMLTQITMQIKTQQTITLETNDKKKKLFQKYQY